MPSLPKKISILPNHSLRLWLASAMSYLAKLMSVYFFGGITTTYCLGLGGREIEGEGGVCVLGGGGGERDREREEDGTRVSPAERGSSRARELRDGKGGEGVRSERASE